MNIIKKLFVNGKWSKLSKDALADDVSNSLLPSATAEDEGKVVSVTETGEYGLSTVESGLPVATAQDAGKVVAVGETGAYELAEAGGGANVFKVYVKPAELVPGTSTVYAYSDKATTKKLTYSQGMEIFNALKKGSVLQIVKSLGTDESNCPVYYPIDFELIEQYSIHKLLAYVVLTDSNTLVRRMITVFYYDD